MLSLAALIVVSIAFSETGRRRFANGRRFGNVLAALGFIAFSGAVVRLALML